VEPRPPELAVRDAAHPETLDSAYRVGDGGVLDLPQFLRRDLAGGAPRPSVVHGSWTQQAADVISSEWRVHREHDRTPPCDGVLVH